MEGELWGETWRDCQNTYFKEKGYTLTVDDNGIFPQEHLGPVRMRSFGVDSEIGLRAEMTAQANEQTAKDPDAILKFLTRHQAVFTEADVDRFLSKHVDKSDRAQVKESLFQNDQILQLKQIDPHGHYWKHKEQDLYTTREVREEEQRVCRYAEQIAENNGCKVSKKSMRAVESTYTLGVDQKEAFLAAIGRDKEFQDQGLVIIQGRAGTGKSYTLQAIREAYEKDSVEVIGLAPTNTVAQDLKTDAGFSEAKTVHKMLFDHKNEIETVSKGSVLIVDEAGMLANDMLTELFHVAKRTESKVILVGDDRQLSSVARGGMFPYLADHHNAVFLTEVRRQDISWQQAMNQHLSAGKVDQALRILSHHDGLHAFQSRQEAEKALVQDWMVYHRSHPEKDKLVMTHRNHKVKDFNQAIRQELKTVGHLPEVEYECLTAKAETWSRERFSVGDRVQFTHTSRKKGIYNGTFGTLEAIQNTSAEKDKTAVQFVVKQDNGQEVVFDPSRFHGFTHGYASTIYKAQGKTTPVAFVYHEGYGSKSLSYVALTRQKEDVHLYTSKQATPDFETLVRQLSREDSKVCSLSFTTQEEILQRVQEEKQEYSRDSQKRYLGAWKFFINHQVPEVAKALGNHIVETAKDYWNRDEVYYTASRDRLVPEPGHHSSVERHGLERERCAHELTCQVDPLMSQSRSQKLDTSVKLYTPDIDRQENLQREHARQLEIKKEQTLSRDYSLGLSL